MSSDNNLIICGSLNNGFYWSVIKITKSGEELWRKDFISDDLWLNGCAIVEVENEDLFVCGDTHRNIADSGVDILLLKLNPEGDTIWTKTYGTLDYDHGQNIINTSDGKILISGQTGGSDNASWEDIYLLKLDYNGDTLWTRRFKDSGEQGAHHLLETANGEYLITGTNLENPDPGELYLLKVDVDGIKLWDKKIGATTGKYGNSTVELSDGSLLVSGSHASENIGAHQVLVVKTDNFGNTIWEKEFGENGYSEKGYSIKQNLDESFTITGTTYIDNLNKDDIIVLKIDENGNQIWFKKFGKSTWDNGKNLIKDTNNDNLITGDLGIGGSIFLTRIDNNGNFK